MPTESHSRVKDYADLMYPTISSQEEKDRYEAAYNSVKRQLWPAGVEAVVESYDNVSYIRTQFNGRVSTINDTVSMLKNSGYLMPSNPFIEISKLNESRDNILTDVAVNDDTAERLVRDVSAMVDMVERTSGDLAIAVGRSASRMSIDSFYVDDSATGDIRSSLYLGVVDADTEKKKRALSSLNGVDFSKRIPRVMFVVDVSRKDYKRGVMVVWKKMHDATAYVLKRKNLFDDTVREFTLWNYDLNPIRIDSDSYIRKHFGPLYGNLDVDDLCVYVDENTAENVVYTYSVKALRPKSTKLDTIFDVQTKRLYLTPTQIAQVKKRIDETIAKVKKYSPDMLLDSTDDVSPYPFIAEMVYGDTSYDWMVAGVNVHSAVKNGEQLDSVKNKAYIGSSFSGISGLLSFGKILMPADPGEIVKRVESSIAANGVAQTIKSILIGTGMLFFSEEKDSVDMGEYETSNNDVSDEVGLLGAVFSSIDTESATIDPNILNVNVFLSRPANTAFVGTVGNALTFSSFNIDKDIGVGAFDPLRDQPIDLTTFEGLSRLITKLRLMFDFNPRRA